MTFSLTILGSSSALPTSTRYPTAHLLNANERFFLIDCGEGTQIQLRKYRIRFSKINHAFISHLHGDHYYGLFGFLSSLSLLGRVNDFHLYAHKNLESLLNFQFKGYSLGFKIIFHQLPENSTEVIYEDKNLTVTTYPLKHRIVANGFLFKEKSKTRNLRKDALKDYNFSIKEILRIKEGADYMDDDGCVIPNKNLTLPAFMPRSYAFCSDTAFKPEIASYVSDVDILYHESTFAEDLKNRAAETGHSTAKQAAKIAKMANAKLLLLGHFSARYKDVSIFEKEAKQVFENAINVIEGKTYSIELKRGTS